MSKLLIISYMFLFALIGISLDAMSIDQQITRIKNAPPQQRVQLMNQFKQNLANMNQTQRIEAIHGLRAKMQEDTHIDSPEHHENHIHQRVPQMQMQQSEDMFSYQHINQVQAGQQIPAMDFSSQIQGTPVPYNTTNFNFMQQR